MPITVAIARWNRCAPSSTSESEEVCSETMPARLPQSRIVVAFKRLLWREGPNRRAARGNDKRRPRPTLLWGMLFLAALHFGLILVFETRHNWRDPLFHERSGRLQQHLAAVKGPKATLVVMLGTSRTGNAFNASI